MNLINWYQFWNLCWKDKAYIWVFLSDFYMSKRTHIYILYYIHMHVHIKYTSIYTYMHILINIKNKSPYTSETLCLYFYLLKTGTWGGIYTYMSIVALLLSTKEWEQHICILAYEWTIKTWLIFIIESYSSWEKYILTRVTKYVTLDNTVLTDRRLLQQGHFKLFMWYMLPQYKFI